MEKSALASLFAGIDNFEKLAQTMSYDTSLPEGVKKLYGQKIMADAAQYLNTRAVSSIQVNINYTNKQATFEVLATGGDANAVNTELKALLDKKYAGNLSRLISAKDPKAGSFSFQLFTVE